MADTVSTRDLTYNKETKTFVTEVSDLKGKRFEIVKGLVNITQPGQRDTTVRKLICIIEVHNPETGNNVKFYKTEEVRDAEGELQYDVFKPRDKKYEGVTLKVFND